MIVDSYLELYTTLFGWLWYGAFWTMLTETGLFLLPFVGIVFDHYVEYRKGYEDGDAEELTLRGLEVDLILAAFVIMIAGSPFVPLDANELVYTPPALTPVTPTPSDATPANSHTTFGVAGFENYPTEVKVPILYYAINKLSVGFGHGVMEVIPPRKGIRQYTEQLRLASIDDPALRQEANDFYRDCFAPARSKYMREMPDNPSINAILTVHGEDDPHWMGSHVYQQVSGYYDSFRADEIRPPFLYSATRDTEWEMGDPDRPTHGKPTCDEWWSSPSIGLRERIIDTIGTLDALSAWVEVGWDTTLRQDALVKTLFENGPPQWTPRGYDYAYTNVVTDDDALINERNVKKLLGIAAAGFESMKNSLNMSVYLNASPSMQALLLMFIYAFAPFVLMLSRYSITSALTISLAMFAIKFLTVIWFMVWWVDQNLLQSIYPNTGDITRLSTISDEFSALDKRIILNYLTTFLYYGAPLLYIIVLGWGGFKAIGGINNMTSTFTSNLRNSAGNVTQLAKKGKK